jgi:general secretion pathway protein M
MKDALREWWSQRSERERWMISGAAILIVASILFFYVYQPINTERLRLQKRVPELRASLAQMHTQVEELKTLQARPRPASLEVALKESAAQSGLGNASITADGPERARVNFASVEFNKWVQWTGRLQSERAFRVESAQVQALPEAGMVKVTAVVSAK